MHEVNCKLKQNLAPVWQEGGKRKGWKTKPQFRSGSGKAKGGAGVTRRRREREREGGTVHSVLIPEECVLLGRRRSQPALLDNCLTSAAMEGCTVGQGV